MPQGFLARVRTLFEGDPGVLKVANDPALAAELLLLFRMILVDGEASEPELAVFRRICSDSFGISEESVEAVVEYLNEMGYETSGEQAVAIFEEFPLERRRQLARHMADIAKADATLSQREVELLRRTLEMLGLHADDAIRRQSS